MAPLERPLRRALYRVRNGLRPLQRRRVAECGWRVVRSAYVSVIVAAEGSARFAGLAHCGCLWECPTCAAAIKASRAREVVELAKRHGEHRMALLTLTVRHGAGDDLRWLRERLANAYRALCRGKPWQRFRARVGLEGSVRAVELTHGKNGWHPHVHVLWCFASARRLSADEQTWLSDRWAEMVERHMGVSFVPDAEHGVKVTAVSDVRYIDKLGLELSDPGTKKSRAGRTPMQIAADYVARPNARDAHLWRDYCEAMRGARQLTWSRKLKDRYGLDVRTDQELCEDEEFTRDDRIVAKIPWEAWRLVRCVPDGPPRLLEALEHGGRPAFDRLLVELLTRGRDRGRALARGEPAR